MHLNADWSFKRSCRLIYYVTETGYVVSDCRPKISPLLLTWQKHFLGSSWNNARKFNFNSWLPTSFMIVTRSLWSQKRMTCFMWDLSSVVRDSLSFFFSCNRSSGIIWALYRGHLRASAKKVDANLDFRAKDESQWVCLSEKINRDWDAEMTNIFSYLTAYLLLFFLI